MTEDRRTGPPGFETPPSGFDPLNATSEELLRYNLPLRPDAGRFPELRGFWEHMFSEPPNFLPCVLKAPAANAANSRRQSSLNWSGAYIKPRHAKVFTQIHGRWCVPKLSASVPPAVSVPGREEGCSTWIGFDGQRAYYQSSLPQVGTMQSLPRDDVAAADPTHYAWFQWWDKGGDEKGEADPPWVIEGFPVSDDDRILCSLFKVGPSAVKFIIKNEMTGNMVVSFDIEAPVRQPPLTVSGATANWILERPSEWPDPEKRFNFPNYGSVDFDHCLALMAEPGGGGAEERNLFGARLIGMREIRQDPPRTAKISTVSSTDKQAFQTAYR